MVPTKTPIQRSLYEVLGQVVHVAVIIKNDERINKQFLGVFVQPVLDLMAPDPVLRPASSTDDIPDNPFAAKMLKGADPIRVQPPRRRYYDQSTRLLGEPIELLNTRLLKAVQAVAFHHARHGMVRDQDTIDVQKDQIHGFS